MKKLALGLLACIALMQARAEDLNWTTDLPKAQAQAKKEDKLVLLDFTGSDWCIWCKRLTRDVFSKEEFADYAKKNLVLVEVDFPRAKEQSQDQKKANQALQEKYKISGYPTIIVLDKEGKQVGQLGYKDNVKDFLNELDKMKKQA